MHKVRRALGLAFISLTALMLVAEPASADAISDEGAFVTKLNELRSSRGLAPLAVNGELTNVARNWSSQMAAAGSISHNPNLAAQAPQNWLRLGENVGQGPDVQPLHDAFVNSPSHFTNMVDGQFTQVGVGVVRTADNTIFVTVNFMTAQAAPAPTAAPAPAAAPSVVAKRVCSKNRKGRTVCRTKKVVRKAKVRRTRRR